MDQHDTDSESVQPTDEVKDVAETTTEAKGMNVLQRILGVFVSPGETFANIDRKPDCLAPMILVVLASLVSTYFILPIVLPESMALQEEKMLEQGMSREQVDKAMEIGAPIGKAMGLASAVIGTVVWMLVAALALWFVGNVILSGQTSYLKVFSVYTYTSVIGVLEAIIKTPLIVMKGSADIQLNCSVFLPAEQSQTLLYYVLQGLDVFVIWRFAVLAIGFVAIYKFSLQKAGWTMVVLFLIRMGIIVTFAQLATRLFSQS